LLGRMTLDTLNAQIIIANQRNKLPTGGHSSQPRGPSPAARVQVRMETVWVIVGSTSMGAEAAALGMRSWVTKKNSHPLSRGLPVGPCMAPPHLDRSMGLRHHQRWISPRGPSLAARARVRMETKENFSAGCQLREWGLVGLGLLTY
jgi:hypothetical protein